MELALRSLINEGTNRNRILTLAGALLSLTVILAFLLYVWGKFPFDRAFTYVSIPGLCLLLGITVFARYYDEQLFLHRLYVGLQAGFIATTIYDIARLSGLIAGFEFTGYPVIIWFGRLLLGAEPDNPLTIVAGLGYHVLTGTLFGVIYSLVAGSSRWFWAVIWALSLEVGMLVSYPKAFGLDFSPTSLLFWISIVGHLAYGISLGAFLQSRNK